MIIRLYNKGDNNVIGTINTAGKTPIASGVGEPILDAWMGANKDVPRVDATRQLESFFASWKNADEYGQVEDEATIEDK